MKATTGEPLRKAVVTLVQIGSSQSRTSISDGSGHFSFKDLSAGSYSLWADRNGYIHRAYEARGRVGAGEVLTLQPGEELHDLVFRLMPTGVITGNVTDQDGDPVEGVGVQVLRPAYVNGEPQLLQLGNATTNDAGEYRVAGLTAGTYKVLAVYSGNGIAPTEESYEPVYYAGSRDSGGAVPVEVRPGDQTSGIDFTLIAARAVRIRGRLISPTNDRRNGISVMLVRNDTGSELAIQNYPTNLTPDGGFEIQSVTPGSYTLIGVVQRSIPNRGGELAGQTSQYTGRMNLEVGNSDLEHVDLVVGPGIDVNGLVRVEGGAKLDLLHGVQIALQPVGISVGIGQPGQIRPDGSFVLAGTPDGLYRLNPLPLMEDLYLKSAHFGAQDILEHDFSISAQDPAGTLELLVSPNGGRLDGNVSYQQQPVAGATVVLLPDASHGNVRRSIVTASTDEHGHFSQGGIAPGQYLALAFLNADQSGWQDPELLARYQERAKPISVDERSRQSTQLELIPEQAPPQ